MSDNKTQTQTSASEQTPEETAKVTHDPFGAPVAPEIIDGAANNKAERERHQAALAALTSARDAVKTQLSALTTEAGHKVLVGAQIALAAAVATLSAEMDYALTAIAHLPPVPAE